MATPIGHMLVGAALGIGYLLPRAGSPASALRALWAQRLGIIGVALLACLPDIDFLLGWPFGNINRFHQGYTHSLGWIAMIVVGIWIIWQRQNRGNGLARFVFLFTVGYSHLLLDIMTVDMGPPYGVYLFWPLYDQRIHTPLLYLFKNLDRIQVFSWHNFKSLIWEIAITLPFPVLILLWKTAPRPGEQVRSNQDR